MRRPPSHSFTRCHHATQAPKNDDAGTDKENAVQVSDRGAGRERYIQSGGLSDLHH
jgi:hypothetical protein